MRMAWVQRSIGGRTVPAEDYKSYGTVRFVDLFPLVGRAMPAGGAFVVDEFDASIRHMAVMNIVNVFHNDGINTRGAQLIFNTHNPIFLNGGGVFHHGAPALLGASRRFPVLFVVGIESKPIQNAMNKQGVIGVQ